MGRNKNDDIPKSDFDVKETQDILSFDSTEDLGECVATFSFGNISDSNIDITSDNFSNNLSVNNTKTNNIKEDTNNKSNNTDSNNNYEVNESNSNITEPLFDNRTTPIANGAAPLIEGEIPDIKRTYMLRASTVRKLNELKSIHPDINACVSTIVDIALDYYYKYITKEGGLQ
jgi:hypothetical protein